MNNVLLGKLLAGGMATVGALFLTLHQTGVIGAIDMRELDVYVTSATTTVSDTDLIEGNFQCRLNKGEQIYENTPFDCSITKITLIDSSDKKHFWYKDFSKTSAESKPISTIKTSEIAAEGNVYKITFVGQYAKKDKFATTAIELVSTNANTTYATINEWFVADKNNDNFNENATFSGKTKYFIGNPHNDITGDVSDGKYKCSWTQTDFSSITNTNCTIYTFSSDSGNNLQSSKFSGSLSVHKTKMEKEKFYVVELNEAADIGVRSSHNYIIVNKSNQILNNINAAVFSKDKFLVLK